jgi:dTMP kinase
MRGRFITFEGGEGAGKSTQIERIRKRLAAAGHDVLVSREPGGSPRAEEIRAFILNGKAKALGPAAEAILFSAARLDHLERTIRPALARGTLVLCDRFSDSTRAYQGALGRVDDKLLRALERIVVAETKPDLTFILDLPAAVGIERTRRRRADKGERADRFEGEDPGFHEALRGAFLRVARGAPERCVVIDAGRDPDEVEEELWVALQARLPELASPEPRSLHVA